MITKVLASVAIALSTAVAIAIPTGADPSVFAVLSCDCDGGPMLPYGAPTMRQQIDEGIQSGLSDLADISG